jgi:hypothetical protein
LSLPLPDKVENVVILFRLLGVELEQGLAGKGVVDGANLTNYSTSIKKSYE